jgi:hypothetical protein
MFIVPCSLTTTALTLSLVLLVAPLAATRAMLPLQTSGMQQTICMAISSLRRVPAPVHVRALLAQGLRSVYDPVGYCELPKVMEHAYQAALASAGAAGSPGDPRTFKEAMASPDADKWYEAMVTEMQAHVKNGTWELVELPRGRKAIGSRWVFKIKCAADGSVDCYKARLVAKGFSQHPGIDFDEIFAPITKWAALRVIFAIEDLELLLL